jgi:hypothetical protein
MKLGTTDMTSQLKNLLQAGAGIVALITISTPASAVTMKAVYTGTVYSSYDQTNVFGQGLGAVLDGLSYTLTYIYDPSTVGAGRSTDATYDQAFGGFGYGNLPTPKISTTLKIGNTSQQSINNSYQDLYYQINDGVSYSYAQHASFDYFNDGLNNKYDYLYSSGYDYSFGIPADLETPYSIALSLVNYSSYFQFADYDYASSVYTRYAFGYLAPTSLTVSRFDGPSQVPVPAALPMLASGIGAIGLIARRRAKKRSAA